MPLDLQRLDQFNPFAVPTIRYVSGAGSSGGPGCTGSPPPCPAISHSSLCHELDAAGNDREQEDSRETEPKRRVRGELGWGRGMGGSSPPAPTPAQLPKSSRLQEDKPGALRAGLRAVCGGDGARPEGRAAPEKR